MAEKQKKTGMLFGKVNIIDALVLLIVVLLVAGVGYRWYLGRNGSGDLMTKPVQVEYKVKVEGIRSFSKDALEKMGGVYHKKTGAKIGEIVKVEAEPAKFESTKADGTVVLAELPEKYDVIVTIRSKGKAGEKNGRSVAYTSESDEIHLGGEFTLKTKWVNATGKVKDIQIAQ